MDMAWILPDPMHSSGVLFMCLDHKGSRVHILVGYWYGNFSASHRSRCRINGKFIINYESLQLQVVPCE